MTDGSSIDADASIDSMIAKDEDVGAIESQAFKERKTYRSNAKKKNNK